MLPVTYDSGRRLAAIAPTASDYLLGESRIHPQKTLPNTMLGIVIVVDGLGWMNLNERLAHTPNIRRLARQRIETVAPSTTGAALTTITTGVLPGEHGLIGYRIRNPKTGTLTTTLSDWDEIDDIRQWQRADTKFEKLQRRNIQSVAIARPAHEFSGLTEAILTGAKYVSGQTITDRFARAQDIARKALQSQKPTLIYLYIDELDRAGHRHGWQSEQWVRRLELFDAELGTFLHTVEALVGPGSNGGFGVAITADHGMIDIAHTNQIVLDQDGPLPGVIGIAGEPRCRYIYCIDELTAQNLAHKLQEQEGERAWVGTREDWIESGVFGPVASEVAERIGDVVLAAREDVTYHSVADDPMSFGMIGQHGSFHDDERGVPLITAGNFAGDDFVSLMNARAGADWHASSSA